MSEMTGTVLARAMLRAALRFSVIVYSSMSGNPMDAEIWKPEDVTTSKPASHTSLAVRPSYAVAALAAVPENASSRRRLVIFIALFLWMRPIVGGVL